MGIKERPGVCIVHANVSIIATIQWPKEEKGQTIQWPKEEKGQTIQWPKEKNGQTIQWPKEK